MKINIGALPVGLVICFVLGLRSVLEFARVGGGELCILELVGYE